MTPHIRQVDAQGARYFDGDRPVERRVSLAIEDQTGMLRISLPDGEVIEWPAAEVRRQPDIAGRGQQVLRWTADPLARIVTHDAAVLRVLPAARRRAPPKGRLRLLGWALAAVAAVALQIGLLIPLLANNLAGFIPAAGERALGEVTLGHIRDAPDETGLAPLPLCEAPEGIAALDQMLARLSGGKDFESVVTVQVLDHPMVNAFALPGGFVVLFRGLIEAAETPDQVAAVLGHEIGHVISRDPTRHALRSAGSIGVLGLLFGDFAGGAAVLFLTERLISAQYSQGAELEADAFARKVLSDAGISPGAWGDMFARLREAHGDTGGLASHFLSHPSLTERITLSHAEVDAGADYGTVLSEEDWAALQDICDS